MSAWNFDRFERSLQSDQLAPIYCIYGDETYLIEKSLSTLIEKGLAGAPRDFNVDIFYGSEAEGADIRDAVEILPMMARRRIVVVKDSDSLKSKDLEELLKIVEKPVDSTLLIFVAEKIDQRKKIFKSIERVGAIVKVDRVSDEALPNWIHTLAHAQKKQMSPEAAMALAQLVGSSLLDIHNEVQKLAQFTGEREIVTEDDVRQVVSHSRLESVFGLTHAIGERDKARALTYLAQLLDHGEKEVGVLALITRHLRILLIIKEGLGSGLTRAQLSSRAGIPSFFVEGYVQQARRWPAEQLEVAYAAGLDTDRALKSSPVSSHIWLENFIIKSCDNR